MDNSGLQMDQDYIFEAKKKWRRVNFSGGDF